MFSLLLIFRAEIEGLRAHLGVTDENRTPLGGESLRQFYRSVWFYLFFFFNFQFFTLFLFLFLFLLLIMLCFFYLLFVLLILIIMVSIVLFRFISFSTLFRCFFMFIILFPFHFYLDYLWSLFFSRTNAFWSNEIIRIWKEDEANGRTSQGDIMSEKEIKRKGFLLSEKR